MDLSFLKPTDPEIRRLAIEETDHTRSSGFAPFEKGPLFAVLVLAFVGIAAVPAQIWRGLRFMISRPQN